MDEPRIMGVREPVGDIARDRERALHRERPFSLQMLVEARAVDVGHDVVEHAGGFA